MTGNPKAVCVIFTNAPIFFFKFRNALVCTQLYLRMSGVNASACSTESGEIKSG